MSKRGAPQCETPRDQPRAPPLRQHATRRATTHASIAMTRALFTLACAALACGASVTARLRDAELAARSMCWPSLSWRGKVPPEQIHCHTKALMITATTQHKNLDGCFC